MLLFFILISLVSTLVSGTCPSGTEAGFTGLCYEPFSKPSTWYQGEKTCALNGGHLASVTSTIMNSFLAGLGDFPFNHTEFWLGGTTNFLGGSWSWSDFQNFTYQNWALGQPSYALGSCSYELISNGKWMSTNCTQLKPFICEYPPIQQQSCSCPTVPSCSTSSPPQTTASSSPSGSCPSILWDYNAQTKKCYYFSSDNHNMSDAMSICQSLAKGSNLVSIHSDYENTWIHDNYINAHHGKVWLWIGLKQSGTIGNYTWVDGTLLDYTFWGDSPQANCAHIDPEYQGDYHWYDDPCVQDPGSNYPVGYVCNYTP